MEENLSNIDILTNKGVEVLNPNTVTLLDIDPDKICPGAVIYPNVTLRGKRTFVGKGARIGIKGPVNLVNSVVGPQVSLGQGAAEEAVFLTGARTGIGFSCRRGTVYEEQAASAEQTDTKMTILFPWVTYGSNVNGCELLACGGVGPELGEFTEFGSGFIHFNFTIRCDKATPSLFGSVPEGVFLRSPRIFVGGNTSVIGPITAEFGAYAAAGIRITGDLKANKLFLGKKIREGFIDYDPGVYSNITTVYRRNIHFIANLIALYHWYQHVRIPLFEPFSQMVHTFVEARKNIEANIQERIDQLELVVSRLPESISLLTKKGSLSENNSLMKSHKKLIENWCWIKDQLNNYQAESEVDCRNRETFLRPIPFPQAETGYTEFIQRISDENCQEGIKWLTGIVTGINQKLRLNS